MYELLTFFPFSNEIEDDRMDNAFKVPLYQSVQLASAMFDNGQRIPLVLYYVTEELRARGKHVLAVLFRSS